MPPKIVKYSLVEENSLDSFNAEINKYIKIGWQPFGSVVMPGNGYAMIQVMVRYETCETL